MSPQPTNITMAMVPEARSHNRAFPINGFTRMRYKQTTLAQYQIYTSTHLLLLQGYWRISCYIHYIHPAKGHSNKLFPLNVQ